MTLMKIIGGIPKANVTNYVAALNKAPILVKAITSGVVYMLGDFSSQIFQGKKVAELNRSRVIGSGLAGLLFHGAMSHCWYGWLDHFIEHTLNLHAWWNIFPMIALDSLIFCPSWNAVYIGFMGLFLKKKARDVWSDVRSTAFPLFKSGLKLWIPANVITYGFVPLQLRVLWCDFVEFFWCIIMSGSHGAH
jgi:protein Mpv17